MADLEEKNEVAVKDSATDETGTVFEEATKEGNALGSLNRIKAQYGLENGPERALEAFDMRDADVLKYIKGKLGGAGALFDGVLQRSAVSTFNTRKSLADLAMTDLQKRIQQGHENQNEQDESEYLNGELMESAAVKSRQENEMAKNDAAWRAEEEKVISDAKTSIQEYARGVESYLKGDDIPTSTSDEERKRILSERAKESKAKNEELTKRAKELAAERDEKLAEIRTRYGTERKNIAGMVDREAQLRAARMQERFGQIVIGKDGKATWKSDSVFGKNIKHYTEMGYNPEAAYAMAVKDTKTSVKNHFTNMVNCGQAEVVLAQLKTLRVQMIDSANKLKDSGSFDPSAGLFLDYTEIDALEDKARSVIKEQAEKLRASEAEQGNQMKTQLKVAVNEAQKFSEDCYSQYSIEEIENKKQEYLNVVDEIYAARPDLIASHRTSIINAFRKAEKAHEKAIGKALAVSTQEEADKVLSEMEKSATYDIDATVLDENGNEVTQKVTMDSHKAIVTTLDQLQKVGLCKGKFYNDMRSRHEKAIVNSKMIEGVLNEYFKFNTDDSRSFGKKVEDRPDVAANRIYLDTDGQGNAVLANVNSGNFVELYHKVEFSDDWISHTTKIDGATLEQIVSSLNDYFHSSLVPKEEEVRNIVGTCLTEAERKYARADFSAGLVQQFQNHLSLMFDPKADAKTYGEARRQEWIARDMAKNWNIPTLGFGFGYEQSLPSTPLPEPRKYGILQSDFKRLRNLMPLAINQRTAMLIKNAMNPEKESIEDEEVNTEE